MCMYVCVLCDESYFPFSYRIENRADFVHLKTSDEALSITLRIYTSNLQLQQEVSLQLRAINLSVKL